MVLCVLLSLSPPNSTPPLFTLYLSHLILIHPFSQLETQKVAIERAKSENAAKLKELETKKQAEVDAAVTESKRLGCVRRAGVTHRGDADNG